MSEMHYSFTYSLLSTFHLVRNILTALIVMGFIVYVLGMSKCQKDCRGPKEGERFSLSFLAIFTLPLSL